MQAGDENTPGVGFPVFATSQDGASLAALTLRDSQSATHAADGAARVTGAAAIVVARGLANSLRTASGLVTAGGDRMPVVALLELSADDVETALPALQRSARTVIEAESLSDSDVVARTLSTINLSAPIAIVVEQSDRLDRLVAQISESLRDWHPAKVTHTIEEDPGLPSALAALREAKRPVVLLGRGAVVGSDLERIAELARVWRAPICLTFSATTMPADRLEQLVAAFPPELPLLPAGTVPWSLALARTDRVLALASGLSEADWFGLTDARLARAPVTRVALDPEPEGVAQTLIRAEAGSFASALVQELERGGTLTADGWSDRFLEAKSKWTQLVEAEAERGAGEDRLTAALSARELVTAAPANTVFVGEGGASGMWLASYSWLRPLMIPVQHASIGASIAMAAGAAEVSGRPIWAVVGDGAFFYGARELAELAERGVPLVLFVFNDSSWNAIRLVQTLFFRRRTVGTDLPEVDYAAHALLHGCDSIRARTPGEFATALSMAQETRTRPLVVDVRLAKGSIPFVGANFILAEADGVLTSLAGAATVSTALAAAKDRPALLANARVISGALRK